MYLQIASLLAIVRKPEQHAGRTVGAMFSGTSHPYLLQVAALWCSFLPGLAIVGLMMGEWLERFRRRPPAIARSRFVCAQPRSQ